MNLTDVFWLVLGLVVAAGCLVLIASIQASRDARLQEHALLRTLGGSRRLISGALAAEFGMLGLFAGVIAVVGAEVSAAVLQRQVFALPFQLHRTRVPRRHPPRAQLYVLRVCRACLGSPSR